MGLSHMYIFIYIYYIYIEIRDRYRYNYIYIVSHLCFRRYFIPFMGVIGMK